MPEIEVTPSSQGGITNQQRGLPVEPPAGYELEGTPDVKTYSYPSSDKEVITRTGPKKISEIGLIGVEETTRTYKPIGESYPNIIETEEKPIYAIQSEERGTENRLIEKEQPLEELPLVKIPKPKPSYKRMRVRADQKRTPLWFAGEPEAATATPHPATPPPPSPEVLNLPIPQGIMARVKVIN
jgi:hypothetical protein